jgi:bifunctional N-acetylglucosamine-1-phosphate-uridyltransferase/glucosamine-1-phosphate-acetyltransferase GlmU-like protein
VEICHAAGEKVAYYISSDSENVIGINTKEELENANHMLKNKKSGLE